MSSGTSSDAARISVSGAMRNVRSARAAASGSASGSGFASGSMRGLDHRPPDAEAGDGRIAPGRRPDRRRGCRPHAPRPGRAAISGSSKSGSDPLAEIGAGRVGEVGEGECPADDRDRIARLQPRLTVRPPTGVPEQSRRLAAGLRVDHGQQPGDGDRVVDLGRPGRTALPDGETGRCLARQVGVAFEPDRCVEPRAAREDPQAPRRIADAEPDRLFLLEPVAATAAVLVATDRRAVVDARHALEQRDEGQLGRFDDPAHSHLAGRQRRDRRGRGVRHADERAIAAESASQQDEPGDDAGSREGRHSRIGQRLHDPIVRDRAVSPNGGTASAR